MNDLRNEISSIRKQELSNFTIELANLCRDTINGFDQAEYLISFKPDQSIVTSVDIATEKAFRKRILELFPESSVLGEEEGGDEASTFLWVIDPIDGTAEFARNIPLYGSIISLYYKGLPLTAVIDHPALNLRLSATYGQGTYLNEKHFLLEESNLQQDESFRFGIAPRSNFIRTKDELLFDKLVQSFPNIRTYHCCYSHTLAIIGALDVTVEWGVKLWDISATRLLIEEAGGTYQVLNTAKEGYYCAVFGQPSGVARILATLS